MKLPFLAPLVVSLLIFQGCVSAPPREPIPVWMIDEDGTIYRKTTEGEEFLYCTDPLAREFFLFHSKDLEALISNEKQGSSLSPIHLPWRLINESLGP